MFRGLQRLSTPNKSALTILLSFFKNCKGQFVGSYKGCINEDVLICIKLYLKKDVLISSCGNESASVS